MGIKTLLPFLKTVTEESDLGNFQDLVAAVDASCWLHKAISISVSRFGEDRRCDFGRINVCFSQGFLEFWCYIWLHFSSQSETDLQFLLGFA